MTRTRYFRVSTLRRKLALGAASGLILGASVGGVVYIGFGRATQTASAAGLARAIAMASAAASTSNACDISNRPAIGKFPGDGNGDGVISDSGSERIPALVAAVASNGAAGYVKYSDLFCQPAPASPAAALAAQASGPSSIPVYASDGSTVVGSVTVGGSSSAASP